MHRLSTIISGLSTFPLTYSAFAILMLSTACVSDSNVGIKQTLSTVVISSPLDGSTLLEGDEVTLLASITDGNSLTDISTFDIAWSVNGINIQECNGQTATPEGLVSCETTFDIPSTNTEIAINVVNPTGASSSDQINVIVEANPPPIAEILSPETGGLYYNDVPINFSGIVLDENHLSENLTVIWESDNVGDLGIVDTPLADGSTNGQALLAEGLHTITLNATDPNGKLGASSVSIEVGPNNVPPDCEITNPTDGSAVATNSVVDISGTATDYDIDNSLLSVEIVSNVDGWIGNPLVATDGTFTSSTAGLSVGPHTISATITDEVGGTCVDSINVLVGVGPTVEIQSPLQGDLFNEGQPISLIGYVYDDVDPSQDIAIEWRSDIDGVISTQSPASNGFTVALVNMTPGTHLLQLQATDTDDFTTVAQITIEVNDLPSAPVIVFDPDPVTSAEDVSIIISVPSTDQENDPITYLYTWSKNNVQQAVQVTSSIAAADTQRGETWTVVVTPDDGKGLGESTAASITILNSPPLVAAVNITPAVAVEGDVLSCNYSGEFDNDQDPITFAYEWFVNGVVIGSSSLLTADNFDRSDLVTCSVTPNDGFEDGLTVSSQQLLISNTPPTLASANISPTTAYESSTLTCNHPASVDPDPADQANLSYTYEWYINSIAIGINQATIDGNQFDKNDQIYCMVTPTDGIDNGSPVTSNSIEISNTPPVLDSASLAPIPAYETDSVMCTPGSESDDDGDSISHSYGWLINGVNINVAANYVDGSQFDKGDNVQCIVTPYDGTDTGTPVTSAGLVISNTAPTINSVIITPNRAQTMDDISCVANGVSDDDNDGVNLSYEWTINGQSAGVTLATLSNTYFQRGDNITCTVTPNDGTDDGLSVTSSATTVLNTLPAIGSADLSPVQAYESSTLQCSPQSVTDPDNDTITYSYTWYVDSINININNPTLNGASFNRDQTVYCEITPNDGFSAGQTVTSNVVLINNTVPVANTPSISPITAYESTTINCANNGGSDTDGDSLTYSYDWKVNGATLGLGTQTITGTYFNRGDTVMCFVIANDGTDLSTAADSQTITIFNTPPSVGSAQISPANPISTDSMLSTVAGWSDDDNDQEGYQYQWYNQNGAMSGATNQTLAPSFMTRGDVVYLIVTPDDGTNTGSPVTSNTVTVGNSPPSAPIIEIQPILAEPDNDLTCSITNPSVDPDGDTVTYTYTWSLNGGAISALTNQPTISYVNTQLSDLWTCTVTPNDGTLNGPAAQSARAIVDATAPDAPILNSIDPYRNVGGVSISGTAEPNSLVTLFLDCASGFSTMQTSANGLGVFSLTMNLSQGDICDFYAVSEDATGNTSNISNTVGTEYCSSPDVYEVDPTINGNSCNTAINILPMLNGSSVLTDNGTTVSISGNIISTVDEDWYYFNTSQTPLSSGINLYNFQVALSSGSSSYDVQVYRGGCAAANANCSGSYDQYDFFAQDDMDGSNHVTPGDTRYCNNNSVYDNCSDFSSAYYIKVIRTDGDTDCTPYVLSVGNGY